ncbi:hypothetical protein D3C74_08590 [compost metagenome]
MKELTQKELQRSIWEGYRLAVYVYTPMCGTCAVARKMLEVVEQMLDTDILVQANINGIPHLVQEYQIASVPALLLFDGVSGNPRVVYRMESVQHLLEQVRSVEA